MRNPFRRKCCEVPLVCGGEHPGEVVSGIAQVGDMTIDFVGVVIRANEFDEEVDRAMEDTSRFLAKRLTEAQQ